MLNGTLLVKIRTRWRPGATHAHKSTSGDQLQRRQEITSQPLPVRSVPDVVYATIKMAGKQNELVYDELICFLGDYVFQFPVRTFLDEDCAGENKLQVKTNVSSPEVTDTSFGMQSVCLLCSITESAVPISALCSGSAVTVHAVPVLCQYWQNFFYGFRVSHHVISSSRSGSFHDPRIRNCSMIGNYD